MESVETRAPGKSGSLTQRVEERYTKRRVPPLETPKSTEQEDPLRIVKRYANRKLYDTRDSRYVTLHQIAGYVRSGEDVRIIDNRTKEDLTDVTLAQIIYEEQKDGKKKSWSVKTLRQLVREGGDRLMTSVTARPREAWDELSRLKDERVLALVGTAKGQLQSVEAEVQRLQARVQELEAKLSGRRKKDDEDPEIQDH
jgi:polyhydroxyalkanoate synthesis repressor PhaR